MEFHYWSRFRRRPRSSPDHPVKDKLEQMNNLLRDIVAAMNDDILLIILVDHGMDKIGIHCGDCVLETISALSFPTPEAIR